MGVRINQRLPRALAGLSAVALMAVAATTTLSAQTTMTPRLVVRALTNGDIDNYKLPSTTQVSGGLETVGLGEPLYLEVQIDIGIPAGQIAGVIWSLTTKPAGSQAALTASPLGSNVPIAEPSDRLVYQVAGRQLLRPDVHGMYVVTATVTAGSSGTATLQQMFIAGTYVGISACTKCHNGGLATVMVPSWSKTAHASIFTNVINGTAIAGYTEGPSCAPCHTVGYDANSTVNDGGFSAMAGQLNWTFPATGQPTNWSAVPAQLQNLANIQCENCHGAGSEHANYGGALDAISVPTNTGACSQCHDEPPYHIKSAAWANSMHAVTTTDPAGNATCVGCHTGTGFIARMNGATITDTSYHSIDCSTCHEPHGLTAPSNDSHLIRNMQSATLADGTKITTTGEGILCMQCHQSRMNVASVDSTAGSAHFGPHEGPQSDMLMGTNGYTYGQEIPSSAHQFVVTNTCIDCHMQTVASTDPAFLNAGDHTFSTTYAPAGKTPEDLVGACQSCHGPDITSFNFPLFDYNGDGKIDGVQTEVQELLDQLSTLLPPNNSVKTSLSIDSTWTKAQLEAAYNWLFVTNDGSKGIHNTAYAVGLIKASIANLQGSN
ncbi:MAG TPA: multiheme c-type cytochrome [Bryobacteraceae bacterium]|nr:multiheme c-type cytochrome [Bryobacteraceae bacterium]